MSRRNGFLRILNNNVDRLDMDLGVGEVCVRLLQCPDSTSDIQDSALVLRAANDSVILAVADGVGGSAGGRDAAARVMDALARCRAEKAAKSAQLRVQILDAIEQANQALLVQGRGAGTTVVVTEISEGVLRGYHAGDSELLVVGQRGKEKLRVVPHSATGFAVEAGVLDEDAAVDHDERHLLLNVIGSQEMRIEVSPPIRLAAADTTLLATDGVLDNLYVHEIIEIIRCGPLPAAADDLCRLARKRMNSENSSKPSKPDDLAVILFRQNKKRGR